MKRVFVLIVVVMAMLTAEAFGANGDLIVDGKLGVGTANPLATGKLFIKDDSTYNSEWNSAGIAITNNSVNDPVLRIGTDKVAGISYIQSMRLNYNWEAPLTLQAAGGNVGIGTAAPEGKLNVVGLLQLGKSNLGGIPWINMTSNMTNSGSTKGMTTHSIFGPYDATSGDIGSLYVGVGTSADGTRNDLYLYNHGCFGGICNMKTAYIYADTTYVSGTIFQSSDSRLKKDIAEKTNSLEKLKQIKVVTYKWKDKGMGEDPQIGVIAQDVEAVFPELVKEVTNQLYLQSENKEGLLPKIKAVDYGKLAAISLQGVKELSNKVDQLEERLQKLETLLNGNKVN
jgi:hypothetical protein